MQAAVQMRSWSSLLQAAATALSTVQAYKDLDTLDNTATTARLLNSTFSTVRSSALPPVIIALQNLTSTYRASGANYTLNRLVTRLQHINSTILLLDSNTTQTLSMLQTTNTFLGSIYQDAEPTIPRLTATLLSMRSQLVPPSSLPSLINGLQAANLQLVLCPDTDALKSHLIQISDALDSAANLVDAVGSALAIYLSTGNIGACWHLHTPAVEQNAHIVSAIIQANVSFASWDQQNQFTLVC